jgi:hypothetical protein
MISNFVKKTGAVLNCECRVLVSRTAHSFSFINKKFSIAEGTLRFNSFQTQLDSNGTFDSGECVEMPLWMTEHLRLRSSGEDANSQTVDHKSARDAFQKLVLTLNSPEILAHVSSLDQIKKQELEEYVEHHIARVLREIAETEVVEFWEQILSHIQSHNIYLLELLMKKQANVRHKTQLLSAVRRFSIKLHDSMQRIYDDIIYREIEKLMKETQTSNSDPFWWFNEHTDDFLVMLVDSMFKKPRELSLKFDIIDLLMKRDFNLYSPENLLRLLITYVTFVSSRENVLKHLSQKNFEFCLNVCTQLFGTDFINQISRREDGNSDEEGTFEPAYTKKDSPMYSNVVLLISTQALIIQTKLDFSEIFKYLPTMYKVFIKFKAVHPKFVGRVNQAAIAKNNFDDFECRMLTIFLYNNFKFPEVKPAINEIEIYKTLIKCKHKLGQLNSHQVLYILFSMRQYIYAFDKAYKNLQNVHRCNEPKTDEIVNKMLAICTEIFLQKFHFWTFNSCLLILNEIVIKYKGIDISTWQQLKISSQLITMMMKEQNELNMIDLFNFATVYKTFIRRVDQTTIDDWNKIFGLLETKYRRMTPLDAKIFRIRLPRLLSNIDNVIVKCAPKSEAKYLELLKSMFNHLEQKYVKN